MAQSKFKTGDRVENSLQGVVLGFKRLIQRLRKSKMKHILTILVILSMTACGMSIEEYDARVKYCNDMQSTPKASGQGFNTGPVNVVCEKDGILFQSKEAK